AARPAHPARRRTALPAARQPSPVPEPSAAVRRGEDRGECQRPGRPLAVRHLRRPAHCLVTISEIRDAVLVGQMLQAHAYWRMHGLIADLLVIAEEASTYERPMHERLEALIQAHSTHTGRDKPGGVFLRSADQIPEADLTLL